jgi:hypothetical protein
MQPSLILIIYEIHIVFEINWIILLFHRGSVDCQLDKFVWYKPIYASNSRDRHDCKESLLYSPENY